MFLRNAKFCLPHHFSKKLHWLASTASNRKIAKIQYDISWFYPEKPFFQSIKTKLNFNAWITLKSSAVIFQSLKPLQPQWPQWPQQPQWPQWPRQHHFIKKFTDPAGLIISSTQLTNTAPFCRMDHQKSNFSLVSDLFFVRGCWGQPMSFFWKLMS